MTTKLEWLRANLKMLSGARAADDDDDLAQSVEERLTEVARVYAVLARSSGMILGMTIGEGDRASLAELMPPLERVGRALCDELAAAGREGYERIPWYVHTSCPAWLPPRPRAEDAEVTRAARDLRASLSRTEGARLGDPATEAERDEAEGAMDAVLPAALEALYAEASGLSVNDGARVHTPLLPLADVEAEQHGIVIGAWGDGTRVFFAPKGILVRPMLPGKKRPKKGKLRALAPDLPAYLDALAGARGDLLSLIAT
jgi:hypothetical protein